MKTNARLPGGLTYTPSTLIHQLLKALFYIHSITPKGMLPVIGKIENLSDGLYNICIVCYNLTNINLKYLTIFVNAMYYIGIETN